MKKKSRSTTKQVVNLFKNLWAKPLTPDTEIPYISAEIVQKICNKSIKYLRTQSLYLEVGYPLTIVGDIHGSLSDLFRILRLFKTPPKANYLFLGDYVDRGANSVSVIILLLALFCEHPVEITLLRGNHEFPSINRNYGFYTEVMKLYGDESIWKLFNEVFSYMPLVAVVNDEIFCVHGGISPRIKTLNEIKMIPMPFKGYDVYPPVADLLWSDPGDDVKLFERNVRGTGHTFGEEAIQQFLQANNLKLLVRAHQCTMKGVHSFSNEMGVTIFSSSNYGGVCGNRCGVCRIGEDKKLYFYSLGTDTEKSAHASAIMVLNNKLGLQIPFSQESPVSSPKHVLPKKVRSATPQITRNILTPPRKKTILNEKNDTIPSEIEMDIHPSLLFLREDTLNIETHANTVDGDENEKRKNRNNELSPEEKANQLLNDVKDQDEHHSKKKHKTHSLQEGDVFADIPKLKKLKKKKKASTNSGDGMNLSEDENDDNNEKNQKNKIKSRPPLPPNPSPNKSSSRSKRSHSKSLRKTKSQIFKPEKENESPSSPSGGKIVIPLMPIYDEIPPQSERKVQEIPLTLSASSPNLTTSLNSSKQPQKQIGKSPLIL